MSGRPVGLAAPAEIWTAGGGPGPLPGGEISPGEASSAGGRGAAGREGLRLSCPFSEAVGRPAGHSPHYGMGGLGAEETG